MKTYGGATEVAIRTKDVSVNHGLKRDMFRPLMLGLRRAIVEKGEIYIKDFGRFQVVPRRVKKSLRGSEHMDYYAVRFKPARGFRKEVGQRWSEKVKVLLVEDSSPQEPASSAVGQESAASSVPAKGARASTSLTQDTDW